MFGFGKKEDFFRLEKDLQGLNKPVLSAFERKELQGRLIRRIRAGAVAEYEYLPGEVKNVADAIRKNAKKVHIPAWSAFMMKERVLDYVESSLRWREQSMLERSGSFLRTGMAAFLLVVFAFSAVLIVPFRTSTVVAKTTYLDQVSGDVKIVRNTLVLEGKSMMKLEEGDKVLTRNGGVATIRFFDDSVSRLAENSSVQMKKLRVAPLNPGITQVEVELEEGRMWTRVVNLAEESTFLANTSLVNAAVEKKGAFDLRANEEKTEIAVYDNVVEVETKSADRKPAKAVIAGFRAAVETNDPTSHVQLEKIYEMEEADQVWIAANLSDDEAYQTELVAGKENAVGIEKDQLLIADDVPLLDEKLKGVRTEIQDAYGVLLRAEEQLVQGFVEEGETGLAEFRQRMEKIIASLPELEEEDPLYGELVRNMIQNTIDTQLKDFATFRPGDRLYKAKESLRHMELALAPTDVAKVEIQLAQAEDALLEMQELLKLGQPEQAQQLLDRYHEQANTFSLHLSDENVQELSKKFLSLVEKQANHMKVMTAIERSLELEEQAPFRDEVRKVRDDTLRKFLIALEQNPEQVSGDLLFEVKDLYDSYVLEEDSSVEDLIDPAVEKLLAKDYQLSFISPDVKEGALQPGVIVLVSQEATANVEMPAWIRVQQEAEESEESLDLDAGRGEESQN